MSSLAPASRPKAALALLLLASASLLLVAHPAGATTYTWNNAGGGSWSNPSNWSPNSVPAQGGDVAVLPALSSAYTVGLDATPAIAEIQIANGPTLDLGVQSLAGVGLVTNAGTITGCGTISGNLDNQGVIDFDCSEIKVASFKGQVTNRNRIALRGGNLTFDGSRVINQGTIDGGGGVVRMQNGARIENTSGARLVAGRGHFYTGVRGAASVIVGGTLESSNKGTFRVAGDTYTDDIILSTDATLTTMSGAKIWVHGAAFRLQGVNEILEGAYFIVDPVTAYVDEGGTTILAGGRIISPAGHHVRGTLRGSGTVVGSVVNEGTLSPDISTGGIVVQGNYVQAAAGRLGLGLSGPEAGQFARLTVTGAATLDGTVAIGTAGGFVPAAGQDFPVMGFASRQGEFARVEADAGLALDPEYGSDKITLRTKATVSVPEPIALPSVLSFSARGTAFHLELPEAADVTVRVFDVRGREVAVLLDERLPAGAYPIALSGRNLPSGVIFARATVRTAADSQVRTARLAFFH